MGVKQSFAETIPVDAHSWQRHGRPWPALCGAVCLPQGPGNACDLYHWLNNSFDELMYEFLLCFDSVINRHRGAMSIAY